MNATSMLADPAIQHALLDGDGRLVAADPVLASLNQRAGGAVGQPFAVPQLATIARLARRLGVLVSRSAVVADDEQDIELWVRAQPEGEGVRMALSGWREVQPWRPTPSRPTPDADFVATEGQWRWETDAALRLTHLSVEADAEYGFDAFALLGQPLTALFALDVVADGIPMLDALARREPLLNQPATLRSTGAAIFLSATIRHDRDGRFAGFLGTVRMPEHASPAMQEKLPLAFTIGLDKALRAPLTRIIANADSIHAQADGPVQDDYAGYAADIANAGRHLMGLVDDLVDLQAIERPGFSLPAEPIDLADVARRAGGLLAVRAANAEVTVARPNLTTKLPALGDFRRALQVMVNLIGNAVRYSPRGSEVTVALGREGPFVIATVGDRGKGIAADDQLRIFDKFERIDPSEPGGSGLGLYIARRLARAMGGDLIVESAPGEGARFTFSLPADPAGHQDQ